MASRSKVGPVNRNYNIILPAPYTVEVWRAGVRLSVSSATQEHRAASLTVNNPWRQLKPSPLTPTARTLNHWRRNSGMVTKTTPGSGGRLNIFRGPDFAPISAEWNARYLSANYGQYDEQLRTEAILEALAKVKDQKWNAGVALAESQGVAKMAVDCMQLIARTRKLIREGDLVGAYNDFRTKTNYMSYPAWKRKYWQEIRHVKSVREAQHIPSGWLYYHFGIKPTLNDISDATLAFQTRLVGPLFTSDYAVVHGYAKQTTKERVPFKSGASYNGIMERNILRSVRVAIHVTPKNEMLAKVSEFGMTNPVEAAYNWLPFSWVADYFSSLGDWLAVLDTGLAWNFADKWTESWRVVASSKFTPVSDATIKYGYPLEPGSIFHKNITRNVRGDLYGPMGSILPQWKRRGPSLQQVSNLASVLASSMRLPIRP